ncbi:MAG: exosortase/archaeosortase family protein [Kiritimatiellae bacterium]|nr:exosortase/archaeosortase family protein [Kiritimatiellia bacterium]
MTNIKQKYTLTRLLHYVRLILLLLLVPVFWQMYGAAIKYTIIMFLEPLEDMSHGWLIPFVSVYALWHQRRELRLAAGAPSWAGFLCAVFSLIVFWFGSRGGQSRIEQISCIALLWSISYAFWGREVARLTAFPIGFLLFTVPISSFLDFFTIHLRFIASAGACSFLNGFGLEIQRSGTAIYSRVAGAEFNVDVADPCSGIRSLFALMALTAIYAWYTQKSLVQKLLLFACAIPLAVIGNMSRIISICLAASWFGQEVATGYYHDYSGYVVFIIAIFLMFQSGRYIAWLDHWIPRQRWIPVALRVNHQVQDNSGFLAKRRNFVPVVALFLLIIALSVIKGQIPSPQYAEANFVAPSLPLRVLEFSGEIPWFCHNEQCLNVENENDLKPIQQPAEHICPKCGGQMYEKSLGEATDLPRDTVILKRQYRSMDGMFYAMNVVIGGRSRYSIHRAELCLPAQGFQMERAEHLRLSLSNGSSVEVRKINARRLNAPDVTLIYWFVSKNRSCSSHTERILLDVWDRSVHNRINRWVMFSVFMPSGLDTPESVERFEAFLSEFYPQVLLRED